MMTNFHDMPVATHTPGPWYVGSLPIITGKFAGHYAIAPIAGPHFAVMLGTGPSDIREANARLIAQAPRLLNALRAAVERQAYRPGEGPDWWEEGRDAIAAAEGRHEAAR